MKPVRRILAGVKDPGARSLPAVEKAARLADACGAELALFHAIAVPVAADPYLYAQGGFESFERQVRDSHLEQLERIAQRLRSGGLRVRVAADWDYPVHEAIVRHASRIKADLVVAEAHAGRRLAPWLLRLTDWELLRTCPVPVLIVKTARAWRRPVVLAAIDPVHAFAKPAGLDAGILKAGAWLSRALGGALHVMHAANPLAGTEAQARQAFDSELRQAKLPRGRRHLVRGAPSEAIPRAARALGAAVVVMGAISRSALKRIVIGNTAERVLGDLPCDVLVVKPARFVTRVAHTRRGVRYTVSTEVPMPY
jgi:universal stress protein E